MKIKLWHRQLIRFGFVGLASTVLHVAVAFALLKLFNQPLVVANVGAFFTAFFFSYFGHALFSFETRGDSRSLGRFGLVYALNLLLIVLISFGVTESGLPPYTGILLVAFVIPIVGFTIQKLWVFDQ